MVYYVGLFAGRNDWAVRLYSSATMPVHAQLLIIDNACQHAWATAGPYAAIIAL